MVLVYSSLISTCTLVVVSFLFLSRLLLVCELLSVTFSTPEGACERVGFTNEGRTRRVRMITLCLSEIVLEIGHATLAGMTETLLHTFMRHKVPKLVGRAPKGQPLRRPVQGRQRRPKWAWHMEIVRRYRCVRSREHLNFLENWSSCTVGNSVVGHVVLSWIMNMGFSDLGWNLL